MLVYDTAKSPVFRAMLSAGMKESKESRIQISDIGSNAMAVILEYLYTNNVNSYWENFPLEIAHGAAKYNLPNLMEFCDKNFIRACNVTNALELYKMAKLHGLQNAMREIAEFTEK